MSSNPLRAPVRAILLAAWLAVMLLPVLAARMAGARRFGQELVRQTYRGIARIVNMRVMVRGELDPRRPLLLVTNHVSYADIITLGAAERLCFTPKAEIARWPVIGWCCKLSGCVFIDRRRSRTRENQAALAAALRQGECICVFPEGTTGDGSRLLPFRSSYFGLAHEDAGGAPLPVQAAAIRYRRIGGRPSDTENMKLVAWIGDDEFFPHFWRFLALESVEAEVNFLPAATIGAFGDRKALAAHCEEQVREALARA